jgi:hypothetical protein
MLDKKEIRKTIGRDVRGKKKLFGLNIFYFLLYQKGEILFLTDGESPSTG